ncbi:hypothetical protein Sango_0253000 [Sesamum angolense]|uniref:Retrotransposon gag domain-containing protein n=1 Tax=Sesamum angolense TaxID=2727404 RepID=A0AAE2C7R4_9LAMI|nr:hypothetical protein Sango_0253000 [Sesamum angolense]
MDTQGKAVKSVNSKLTILKSSSSTTKSVGVTTRSMSKKLKESSQMSPIAEYIEKNLHSPSYVGESDANKSPPSSPRSMSSYSFTTNVAPAMVTNATTIKEQLASLTRAIEGLTKHVQEQWIDCSVDNKEIMRRKVISWGNKLRSKIERSSKSSLTYSKPYAPRIDSLKMPMVKQFVRSLKDNAFDWYTDLEAGSIDGWEQLEQKCLNRFYSTQRTISMVELINSRQWKEEPVIDHINRSFEELATRAHDMELSMIESGVEGPPVQELCRNKEKQEVKKGGKPFSKALSKE